MWPRVPPATQARLSARYGPDSRAAASGRQQYFTGPLRDGGGPAVQPAPTAVRPGRDAPGGQLRDRPPRARASHGRTDRGAADRPAAPRRAGPASATPTIYPLGGPDLTTARRLAGDGRRRGVLYACDTLDCDAHAEIVRANLAAIGIRLEIRRFSFGEMFARVLTPDEPFDLSLFGWIGDTADPSEFIDLMFSYYAAPTRFLERTPLGPRMRAASQAHGRRADRGLR